ncbi:hypothetical protein ACWD0J_31100 [Streptomyces sp. NPDC003011]
MNLLVTGAAGLIGSANVRTPLASGGPDAPRIAVLDELVRAGTPGDPGLGRPRPEFVPSDLHDARPVGELTADAGRRPARAADVERRRRPRAGRDASGVLRATHSGEPTRSHLAREVFRHRAARPDRVRPVGSAAGARPALPPAHSAPAHGRRQQPGLPPLRDGRCAPPEVPSRIRKESPA